MGIMFVELEIKNAARDDLAPLVTDALVDTGATYLCLPESAVLQLSLKKIGERVAEMADGRETKVDVVGPVLLAYQNRVCITDAVVMGDEPLLGAIPLQQLDLVIVPQHEKVVPNPDSPNFPKALVKGAR